MNKSYKTHAQVNSQVLQLALLIHRHVDKIHSVLRALSLTVIVILIVNRVPAVHYIPQAVTLCDALQSFFRRRAAVTLDTTYIKSDIMTY
jgi:hypothetical protein